MGTRIPSMPSHSHPIGTGCALQQVQVSRCGIWRARTWLKSCVLRFLAPRVQSHLNACPWLGQLMARLCSLATVTAWLGCGRCPKSGLANCFCLRFQTPVKQTDHCIESAAARVSEVFMCGYSSAFP